MRTQLVDGLFADLLQVVRFLRVYFYRLDFLDFYVFTWSSNEPGTFVCLLDGVEVSCCKGTTGDYTTPDLSDGKHSFSVSSVDPLGNKGRPVTVEWETGE